MRDGRLTCVNEDALIKAAAPVSEKMFRIYNRIKDRPEAADPQAAVETLYRRATRTHGRLGVTGKPDRLSPAMRRVCNPLSGYIKKLLGELAPLIWTLLQI